MFTFEYTSKWKLQFEDEAILTDARIEVHNQVCNNIFNLLTVNQGKYFSNSSTLTSPTPQETEKTKKTQVSGKYAAAFPLTYTTVCLLHSAVSNYFCTYTQIRFYYLSKMHITGISESSLAKV